MTPLLAGVRVLELGQLVAAPLCGLQLLDLGAEVLKVEPPGGEAGRTLPPFDDHGESLLFAALNRGKRGVEVDRGDVDALRALVAEADVVVENAAGAFALRHQDALAARPALVWCAITGRGVAAPGRALDPSLQAAMGLLALTGAPDGPPLRVPVPLVDVTTGLAATQAVLAALWRVERGERGGLLDVALIDAAAALTGIAGLSALNGEPWRRMGSESPLAVPSGVFATRDGFVQVVAVTERQWSGLCRSLAHPEWLDDPRCHDAGTRLAHRELVHGRLAEAFGARGTEEVVAAISAAGGLAEPVREIEEAWADPVLRERGLLGELAGRPLPTFALAGVHPGAPVLEPYRRSSS